VHIVFPYLPWRVNPEAATEAPGEPVLLYLRKLKGIFLHLTHPYFLHQRLAQKSYPPRVKAMLSFLGSRKTDT
jgi:hypothetical protein